MIERDFDYAEVYRKMFSAKEKHREIEEIVTDLQNELRLIKEESFLVHAMRLIIELDHRTTSPLYQRLQSPMRQTLYMIDIYYSVENREETEEIDGERWDRIAILLDEVEMTYFVNIGFPNDGDLFHDERDEQIDVAMSTFMGYYANAVINYEEQTRDRIERYFRPYDAIVKRLFGFSVDEALQYIAHIRKLNNDKLNAVIRPYADTYSYYTTHPKEWKKLTDIFKERGLTDPRDWWYEPELSGMMKTMTTNPGEVHIHTREELEDVEIEASSLRCITTFFTYDKETAKGKTVFYSDKRHSESHPLIQLGDRYVCPINKFLFEGMYDRIDDALMKPENGAKKYKQNKDLAFERKVAELFRQFFPVNTKIFVNYTVDGATENDLLVVFGNTCIVVEIKNCGFRAPFRDPIKAYPRIKRDYSKAIQLGYDQCKRVEDCLLSGKDVEIRDVDSKKLLYHLRSNRIGDVWTMVVTDFKYGVIQTDLRKLLKKDDDALYPWSVCVDDLETLMLLMKKKLKGIASARFLEFLDYRERMQGHVMCFDELEICGWYLCDRNQFKEYADADSLINTTPPMGEIFDAYYQAGLGFKNELDIEYKKHYPIADYPKSFEMKVLTGGM